MDDDPAGSRRPDVCVTGLDVLQALLYQPTSIVGCAMSTRSKGRVPDLDDCIRSLRRREWSAYHVVCISRASMPWIAASACTEWQLLQVHLGVTLGRHYFTRCETVSSSGCRFGVSPSRLHACTYSVSSVCVCVHIVAISGQATFLSKALDCYPQLPL